MCLGYGDFSDLKDGWQLFYDFFTKPLFFTNKNITNRLSGLDDQTKHAPLTQLHSTHLIGTVCVIVLICIINIHTNWRGR
jgi:hypothetical protein